MKKGGKRITVRVDYSTWRALKRRAREAGISVSDLASRRLLYATNQLRASGPEESNDAGEE